MRRKIFQVISNPLVSGSMIIFIGSHAGNFFNLLFNLFMSRNLSSSDYGSLVSLVSLLTLVSLPAGSITPTLIKFSAVYFARNDLGMVRGLFLKVFKICFFLALIALGIFIVFSIPIGEFFKIRNQFLIFILALSVFFSFIGVINLPLLQAKLLFKFISFTNLLGAVTKFVAGVFFVIVGYSVVGALWAVFLSGLIPYVLSFIPLRFLFNREHVLSEIVSLKSLFLYGAPASLAFFALTSFISVDILLVKHFFNPEIAGTYAAGLSLVGRVIFYISAPIGMVMFPLVVQKHTRNENYHSIFGLSLLLVILASIPILIFYFAYPQLAIAFLVKKSEYLVVSNLLGIFGIYMMLYSLLSVVVNFYLSINSTKVFIPLCAGVVLQALGIWMYHENFLQVILISLTITGLLLFGLLLYYYSTMYEKRK